MINFQFAVRYPPFFQEHAAAGFQPVNGGLNLSLAEVKNQTLKCQFPILNAQFPISRMGPSTLPFDPSTELRTSFAQGKLRASIEGGRDHPAGPAPSAAGQLRYSLADGRFAHAAPARQKNGFFIPNSQ